MYFTVANHNNAKNPNGFVNYEVEFEDLEDMTTSGCAYCACKLKDEYRLDDNFDGNVDVLVIDIDKVCTLEQAKELFKKYEFYLITTKSHQREKNGEVCDRFRLFFKLDKTIHIREHIENIYSQFIDKFTFIDTSCRNVSRYFYASPSDAIVYHNQGKKYSTNIIIETEVEIAEQEKPVQYNNPDDIFIYNEITEDWRNSYGDVLEGGNGELDNEAHLKGIQKYLDEEYTPGNRANCLFQAGIMMLRDGFDENFMIDYLLVEFNKRGGDKQSVAMQQLRNAVKYV